MTFRDIFKSSFLESSSSITFFDMGIVLVLAFLLGLYIFFIYKKTYSGVMYSASFGVTLIALSLITSLLIMTIVSNIVLSLGMVGALSIVRFRTPVKEPMDIVFLFWAIAVGIVLAAGMIPLAVFGSVFIGIVLLVSSKRKTRDNPYILVLRCIDEKSEKEAIKFISEKLKEIILRAKVWKAEP